MGEIMRVGDELRGESRHVTEEKMIAFERVIWHRVANVHSDPVVARKSGMARPIASGQNQLAFLHELMEKHFADGWVRGGKIAARWICPVYSDDYITTRAIVNAIEIVNGRRRALLDIWCENNRGEKTAIGTASAYIT